MAIFVGFDQKFGGLQINLQIFDFIDFFGGSPSKSKYIAYITYLRRKTGHVHTIDINKTYIQLDLL